MSSKTKGSASAEYNQVYKQLLFGTTQSKYIALLSPVVPLVYITYALFSELDRGDAQALLLGLFSLALLIVLISKMTRDRLKADMLRAQEKERKDLQLVLADLEGSEAFAWIIRCGLVIALGVIAMMLWDLKVAPMVKHFFILGVLSMGFGIVWASKTVRDQTDARLFNTMEESKGAEK